MNTAGKVALGVGVAAGMIGLAIALGKPKQQAVPPRVGPEGASKPPPVILPFILRPEATGDVMEINDLAKMLPWAIKRAKDLGVRDWGSTKAALEKIASATTGKRILSVVMTQLPQMGAIPWEQVLDYGKNVPWSMIKPAAQAWLKSKGIG